MAGGGAPAGLGLELTRSNSGEKDLMPFGRKHAVVTVHTPGTGSFFPRLTGGIRMVADCHLPDGREKCACPPGFAGGRGVRAVNGYRAACVLFALFFGLLTATSHAGPINLIQDGGFESPVLTSGAVQTESFGPYTADQVLPIGTFGPWFVIGPSGIGFG